MYRKINKLEAPVKPAADNVFIATAWSPFWKGVCGAGSFITGLLFLGRTFLYAIVDGFSALFLGSALLITAPARFFGSHQPWLRGYWRMGWGSPSTGIPLVKNAGFSISEMFGIGILMNSVLARRGLWAMKY